MKITCISASNIEVARETSASTRACEIARRIMLEAGLAGLEVEIVRLIDYEMVPCRMCGGCVNSGRCKRDEAFNQVYGQMIDSDALLVVVPHYAPIPSKVMILLEKLEELAYLGWVQDPEYHFPLVGKPVGLIAHGGQGANALGYYKTALLDPLAGAFASVQMKVVGAGEQYPNGVTFGIQSLRKREGSVFVEIEHDWGEIQRRIEPLVANLVRELKHQSPQV